MNVRNAYFSIITKVVTVALGIAVVIGVKNAAVEFGNNLIHKQETRIGQR